MVSVCIATYNGEKYIKQQIESILTQIDIDDEIVISDDLSTDLTTEIVNSIDDLRIKLYINNNPSGRPTENFQNALNKSKGEFIFLADQDDIWLENKYNDSKHLLLKYDLVLSDSILVDENLNVLKKSFFNFHKSKKGVLINSIKNSYFGSCMAFRRKILDFALPFPKSREIGHDVWLGLVAEMTGSVYFYNKPLILYRRHASAVTSHGIGKSKRSLAKKFLGRLIMLQHVFVFYINYKWKKV